jgi:endonuclease/exonuclease/phosphatase family metal-dependent hydrolase
MSSITICTFNVENLFGRYKVFGYLPGDQYKHKVLSPEELDEAGGFLPGEIASKDSFDIFTKGDWRTLTAKALKGSTENYPDIACLMEVESMRVLRRFNKDYLDKIYPHTLLVDSHDPRFIDVGVLSKHEIVDVKTHMDEPYKDKSGYLFSRDCLEVTFDIEGTPLTIFVNHLKSKLGKAGDDTSDKKRLAQATRVAELVKERYKESAFTDRAFAVVGDFNDSPDSEYLKPLVKDLGLENVVKRISDKTNQWTHWWAGKNLVNQIDYILVSSKIANNSTKEPYIEHRGISSAKKNSYFGTSDDNKGEEINFEFERFPEVTDKIEASDHCPVFFEIKL